MFTLIPVPVPRNEQDWWKKNRLYPVRVELDYDTLLARVGEREYRLLPQPDGSYIAAYKTSDRFIEAGRFDQHRVSRTLTVGAARDVKALRSAVFNIDYSYVLAVRTPKGLAHTGSCARLSEGPSVYTVKDEECRCHKCGEGFE